jgi:hypothetical protein
MNGQRDITRALAGLNHKAHYVQNFSHVAKQTKKTKARDVPFRLPYGRPTRDSTKYFGGSRDMLYFTGGDYKLQNTLKAQELRCVASGAVVAP